jgi:RNA polymerase sigma factor (sigma-70 family)
VAVEAGAVVVSGDEWFDTVYAAQYPSLVRLAYRPVAYLRRAVASRCTSWVRRRALERRHPGSVDHATGSAVPDADAAAVREALSRLKPRQRAAVFLRYYLDLPEAEIAAALGCRSGTVKSLLHRSLAVLKEQVGED